MRRYYTLQDANLAPGWSEIAEFLEGGKLAWEVLESDLGLPDRLAFLCQHHEKMIPHVHKFLTKTVNLETFRRSLAGFDPVYNAVYHAGCDFLDAIDVLAVPVIVETFTDVVPTLSEASRVCRNWPSSWKALLKEDVTISHVTLSDLAPYLKASL